MESCTCGNPVVQPIGKGRTRHYCSDRCRKHAQRERKNSSDVTKLDVTKLPDIRFYCGVSNKHWNHHAVSPGNYACIAPVCGRTAETQMLNYVSLSKDVEAVLMDSSAFSDKSRLSFEEAKNRQVSHAYRFGYVHQVSHIASYDLLIDEKWIDGERSKQRWERDAAEEAVKVTVQAAQYLSRNRKALWGAFGHRVGLALSAQGVEVDQYLRCAKQIVSCMEETDIFGLGGFCITGLLPDAILPSFCEIMSVVIPYLGSAGVSRVHVWGVIYPQALGYLLYLCNQSGIGLSTDSSGPCRYPTLGEWGYGSWRDNSYKRPSVLASCKVTDGHGNKVPTCGPDTRCLGLDRIRHVQLTREWLAHFREREPELYRPVVLSAYRQLSWMEVAS